MNKVILMGRLTRDPDVRYTQGENSMCIARYTLAVDRMGKKQDNQQNADFIPCVSFGKLGEFAEKYAKKGTKLAIIGRIQTGNYTNKDGVKVYTTEIVVESQEFAESKATGQQSNDQTKTEQQKPAQQDNDQTKTEQQKPAQQDSGYDGFMNIPDGIDEELPFA